MIVLTGAAGFIGSCLLTDLLAAGYQDIVIVDDFDRPERAANFGGKAFLEKVPRHELEVWLKGKEKQIAYILHLGARTDTAETDRSIFAKLNLTYSQMLWRYCSQFEIPFIYASSAATYGDGSLGFDDAHAQIPSLRPLNPYGQSKQDFDLWALQQSEQPPSWAGLKFFNVYGPNEWHKGRMASVIFHAFHQIQKNGNLKLFRSHRPDFADGEQKRDFIYVRDLTKVILFLMEQSSVAHILNLGTGKARTFWDLGQAVFAAMDRTPEIGFIDTPADIRNTYQYFTQAKMSKLRGLGFEASFTPLEQGVETYVKQNLSLGKYY
ncbi:MAG: ADP-glyceromanno-heptose 6-epimerase [Bacteroidota bacterium]